MKTLILTLVAVVLVSAAPGETNSEKDSVLAAMNAYKSALIHKDRAALEKLLSY